MKGRFNKLTTMFFAFIMLLVMATPKQVVFADSIGKQITIIHTNDTHSRVASDEKDGSSKVNPITLFGLVL